jgi:ABC-type amino acid transport substrate-binding protein
MAAAFAMVGKDLREVFNAFYKHLIKDGTYQALIKNIIPRVSVISPIFLR